MTLTPTRSSAVAASSSRTSRRYFGVHIDFHARADDTELGRRVTRENVLRWLRRVSPDYLQYDCKGEFGLLSYPDATAGTSAPHLHGDALATHRRAAAELGIPFYVHVLGLMDRWVAAHRPQWSSVDADGKPHASAVSTFSDYARERLIPILREVIDRYNVDGIWLDGQCWAVQPDYCEPAICRFNVAYPGCPVPRRPGDPYWREWMDIHRQQFGAYVREVVEAVKAHRSDVKVISNWHYSDMTPIPWSVPLDFISADVPPAHVLTNTRTTARVMASYGQPWDLILWGFLAYSLSEEFFTHKPVEQLCQESALIITQGGGAGVYLYPDRHGELAASQIHLLEHVSAFCRERRSLCEGTASGSQIAVLFDPDTRYTQSEFVYATSVEEIAEVHGAIAATLESGFSVDVAVSHQEPWRQGWAIIVVPEAQHMSPQTYRGLLEFAERGGSLILLGADTADRFRNHLGVTYVGSAKNCRSMIQRDNIAGCEPGSVMVNGRWQSVKLAGATAIAYRTPGYHEALGRGPAATIAEYGRGRIVAVYGPVASAYQNTRHPWLRRFIGDLLARLHRPIARVEGNPDIELAIRRRGDEWVLHLSNVGGMPDQKGPPGRIVIDRVRPSEPVRIRIHMEHPPTDIALAFGDRSVRVIDEQDGKLVIEVPPVHIHQALLIRQ